MDSLPSKPRLREQFRAVMRVNHYSIRTEKTYWYWIRYFLRFNQLRHPLDLGPKEVNIFLSWLASERKVAASTQNLALNAIVFLYARVLEQPLGDIGETVRAKRPPRLRWNGNGCFHLAAFVSMMRGSASVIIFTSVPFNVQ